MSKGSNRRPGSGYEDNWDRIFGKKDYQIEVAGDTVFGLDPAKTYRTEVAKDGCISYWEEQTKKNQDLRKRLDSLPTKTFTLIRPFIGGNCGECKHWRKSLTSPLYEACGNALVIDMLSTDRWMSLMPPADFGCNKFERKP